MYTAQQKLGNVARGLNDKKLLFCVQVVLKQWGDHKMSHPSLDTLKGERKRY